MRSAYYFEKKSVGQVDKLEILFKVWKLSVFIEIV